MTGNGIFAHMIILRDGFSIKQDFDNFISNR